MSQNTPDRFAVLADIHGNRWALEAVLGEITRRGIGTILDLGDSLYGPLDPAGTYDLLCSNNIISVRGNEDRIITEQSTSNKTSATLDFVKRSIDKSVLSWLAALPKSHVMLGEILMIHGTPDQDDVYVLREVTQAGVRERTTEAISGLLSSVSQPLVLCGHDHLPGSRELSDERLVVNPGSVGLQAFEDDVPLPHSIATESPYARFAILTKSAKSWNAEFLQVKYDWKMAAEIAIRNGREDWAHWLRTGQTVD